MPHRFEPLFAPIIATLASFFAGLVALFDNGGAFLAGVIIDNRTLVFACLVGACGGALVSICLFPLKDMSMRTVAAKFLGSGITSAIFSPYIIRFFQPQPDAEFVLFVSGSVALCAIQVIRGIKRLVDKKTKGFLSDDEPPKAP